MIPSLTVRTMITLAEGNHDQHIAANEDYAHYLASVASQPKDGLLLRLLPRPLRSLVKARMAARAYERSLIQLWEVSPHLLKDIGVVLTQGPALPDHLVPAPQAVVDHVAAAASEKLAQRIDIPVPAPVPMLPEAAPRVLRTPEAQPNAQHSLA